MAKLSYVLCILQSFEIFHDRIGPGLRDIVTALTFEGFQIPAWNLVGWHKVQRSKSLQKHYRVIVSAMASQITSVSIVCSTVCSGTDQRKHQSSTSLAFVRGIHWWPLDSLHKGPITWKKFPFDDIIMKLSGFSNAMFQQFLYIPQVWVNNSGCKRSHSISLWILGLPSSL